MSVSSICFEGCGDNTSAQYDKKEQEGRHCCILLISSILIPGPSCCSSRKWSSSFHKFASPLLFTGCKAEYGMRAISNRHTAPIGNQSRNLRAGTLQLLPFQGCTVPALGVRCRIRTPAQTFRRLLRPLSPHASADASTNMAYIHTPHTPAPTPRRDAAANTMLTVCSSG